MSSKTVFKPLTLLLFTIIVAANAQDFSRKDDRYQFTISKQFDVEAGGSLIIDNISGNIIVTSWDKKSVAIQDRLQLDVFTEEEAREVSERIEESYSAFGNTVTIAGRGGWHSIERTLEISVPKKFDLDVQTSNGNISAADLEGFIELTTSNGNIDLKNITGEVIVKTSAGNLFLENIKAPLNGRTSGGNIQLKDIFEEADVNTSGGNIRVVNAQKDINLYTSGGRISLRQIGGNVIASTSGGDIEAEDCAGEADLRTSGGDIEAVNIGSRLEMSTSGGDIWGVNVNGTVIAKTSGGDVELNNIRGAVRAETSAGNIEVEITLTDFKQDHRVFLRTSTGTIDLTLPEKFPAAITAEIQDAGGRWDRHEIYSDFPLSQQETAGRRSLRRTGNINGGGDEIILEASNGDIYIRKATK